MCYFLNQLEINYQKLQKYEASRCTRMQYVARNVFNLLHKNEEKIAKKMLNLCNAIILNDAYIFNDDAYIVLLNMQFIKSKLENEHDASNPRFSVNAVTIDGIYIQNNLAFEHFVSALNTFTNT